MKKYIVVMLLLIIGLGVSAYAMSLAPKIQEGEVATPFVLKDLNGKSVSLASYRGNIVLLNFWASWCPPCRSEMPSIQKLYEKMAGKKFVILAVSVERAPKGKIASFISENGYTFPVLLDDGGKVSSAYGITSIPTTYLLDKKGQILKKEVGSRDWSDPEIIDKLLDLTIRTEQPVAEINN